METIGRYEILEKLGQGGMGVVHRAFDTQLQRVVAVKLISAPIEENSELRERFFREARAAGQLTHKNIITIYDLGEHEGRPYLAMELLEGEDLQRKLARSEPLSLARKVDLAIGLCEALEFAHGHGIVHRDIKPANIFITSSSSTVKILDFGLARLVTSELTNSNMMMGTLNYMAPEQVRGERADPRSDIFSVGVVVYELLSGRKAFQGDSFASTLFKILETEPPPLGDIDPRLPPDIVAIVNRTLAKSRDQRYQSVTDLLADLGAFRQQLGFQDSPARGHSVATPPHRIPSDAPRRPPSGPAVRTEPIADPLSSDAPTGTPMPTPTGVPVPPEIAGRRTLRPPALIAGAAVAGAVALAIYFGFVRQPGSTPPAASSSATSPAPGVPPTPPVAPATDASAVADTRRGAEDARTRMAQARAAARTARASTIAAEAYNSAAAAEREAERLYKAGRLADATAKYYEASGLYRSAEIAAQSRASAAGAPPPMAGPPVQEPPASNPPATVPAPERQPQPAPAATPPPATPPVTPPPVTTPPAPVAPPPQPASPPATTPEPAARAEDAINDLLSRYESALEARSLDALKRLWPSLRGAQQTAIQNEFQHSSRIEVDLMRPQIAISGTSATVIFVRRYHLQTTDGQRLQTDTRTTMTLRQASGGWVIEEIRFEPVR